MELTLKPTAMGKEERAKKSQQLSKTLENALKAAVDRSSREARKDQEALQGVTGESAEKSEGQYAKDNLGRTYLVINSREFIRLEHLGLNTIEKNMERIDKITKFSARFIKQ